MALSKMYNNHKIILKVNKEYLICIDQNPEK